MVRILRSLLQKSRKVAATEVVQQLYADLLTNCYNSFHLQ